MKPNQENASNLDQEFEALTSDNNDFYKCKILHKDIKEFENMTIA